ncbi:hypothetical protein [Streptomyces cavernae]|uniref:hypothetical protein n=1 Tax=Streptomyces cavernae TaxID=2259034 RepID=UPI000FEBAA92|nr:hypothetical protein [Streptomyces cavernae]
MESGPAVFAGTVFALFGGGLLMWTTVRLRQGAPVARGVSQIASAALASVTGVAALLLGVWCFTQI